MSAIAIALTQAAIPIPTQGNSIPIVLVADTRQPGAPSPIRNGTRFAAAPLAALGASGTLLYKEGSAFSGPAALDSSPAAPYLAQLPEQ